MPRFQGMNALLRVAEQAREVSPMSKTSAEAELSLEQMNRAVCEALAPEADRERSLLWRCSAGVWTPNRIHLWKPACEHMEALLRRDEARWQRYILNVIALGSGDRRWLLRDDWPKTSVDILAAFHAALTAPPEQKLKAAYRAVRGE